MTLTKKNKKQKQGHVFCFWSDGGDGDAPPGVYEKALRSLSCCYEDIKGVTVAFANGSALSTGAGRGHPQLSHEDPALH